VKIGIQKVTRDGIFTLKFYSISPEYLKSYISDVVVQMSN
jgi:hypothetical protein